jgi:hypothetical protein
MASNIVSYGDDLVKEVPMVSTFVVRWKAERFFTEYYYYLINAGGDMFNFLGPKFKKNLFFSIKAKKHIV